MTDMENNDDVDVDTTVDNTEDNNNDSDAGNTVSKEEYDALMAKYEKVNGNFKKAKAKQNNKSTTTDPVDGNSLKKELREEISFYTKHPDAESHEEAIAEYRDKWLTLDEAYRLVLSKENPSSLIDPQTKAKADAGQKQLDWIANTDAWWLDFSTMTSAEALKLSYDDQDKYWDYKKNGGK